MATADARAAADNAHSRLRQRRCARSLRSDKDGFRFLAMML
jgi:hypothetical protein